ncbi:MAG: S-layer homology domain-containing protein [Firmicutes bacterium]|nr:S-layer homology domain-containing protein [Bacillota bacterium]
MNKAANIIIAVIILTMLSGFLTSFAEQLTIEPAFFDDADNITVQDVKAAVKVTSLANYKDKEKFINAAAEDGQKFGDLVDINLTNIKAVQNNDHMVVVEGEALDEEGMVYYALDSGDKITVEKTVHNQTGVRYYFYAYDELAEIINRHGLGAPTSFEYLPFGVKINTGKGEFVYIVDGCIDTYGPKTGTDYYILEHDTVYTYDNYLKWEETKDKNMRLWSEHINADKTDSYGEKIEFNTFEKKYRSTFKADIDGEIKDFEWGFCKCTVPYGLGSSTTYGIYYSTEPNKYYVTTSKSNNMIHWSQAYLVEDAQGKNLKVTSLGERHRYTQMTVMIDSDYNVTKIELLFADPQKGDELKNANIDMSTYKDNGNFKSFLDYGYTFAIGEIEKNYYIEPETEFISLSSNHKPQYVAEFEIDIDSEQEKTWIGEVAENGKVKCKITYFSTYGFHTGRPNEGMVTLSGNSKEFNLMESGYDRNDSFMRYTTGKIGVPDPSAPKHSLQKSGVIELNWKTPSEYKTKQLTAKIYDCTYIEDGINFHTDSNGKRLEGAKVHVGKVIDITQKGDMINLDETEEIPEQEPTEELDETPQKAAFDDVSPDHWAYDEIQYFYKAGIVEGIDESSFEPERNVSR